MAQNYVDELCHRLLQHSESSLCLTAISESSALFTSLVCSQAFAKGVGKKNLKIYSLYNIKKELLAYPKQLQIFFDSCFVCMKSESISPSSHIGLFAIRQTVTRQAPLSVGPSRQEYWSGLPLKQPFNKKAFSLSFCEPLNHEKYISGKCKTLKKDEFFILLNDV